MIADKSRMTIDEQIAWYNGSKGEKEFDENLYWSNLREAGYSDEELAQIKAGLEPTAAQKYRESKHVPRISYSLYQKKTRTVKKTGIKEKKMKTMKQKTIKTIDISGKNDKIETASVK